MFIDTVTMHDDCIKQRTHQLNDCGFCELPLRAKWMYHVTKFSAPCSIAIEHNNFTL